MHGRVYRGAGLLALASTAFVFAGARTVEPAPRGAVSDHVVVISLDGLRPDAIDKFGARTLQRLIREGSSSMQAQTIYPSKTLPSHTSMLTGVEPSVHGVTWNTKETESHGYVPVPTIFDLGRREGFHTAAFFAKEKFQHLQRPGSFDHSQAPDGAHWMATQTISDVRDYLRHERPTLLFVHIAEADYAGHSMGWMSFGYGWAVKRADAAVAEVLEAADAGFGRGNYTVIVTSDHGGHGRNHGTRDPRDMTIPWISWGKGVAAGVDLGPGIRTTDTAATVLWLLGVNVPGSWTGAPVAAAFTADAQRLANAAVTTVEPARATN